MLTTAPPTSALATSHPCAPHSFLLKCADLGPADVLLRLPGRDPAWLGSSWLAPSPPSSPWLNVPSAHSTEGGSWSPGGFLAISVSFTTVHHDPLVHLPTGLLVCCLPPQPVCKPQVGPGPFWALQYPPPVTNSSIDKYKQVGRDRAGEGPEPPTREIFWGCESPGRSGPHFLLPRPGQTRAPCHAVPNPAKTCQDDRARACSCSISPPPSGSG